MIWNFSFLGYLLSIEENEILYDVAEMLYFKCLHVWMLHGYEIVCFRCFQYNFCVWNMPILLVNLIKLKICVAFWIQNNVVGEENYFVLDILSRSAKIICMTSWLFMVCQGELVKGRLSKSRLRLEYISWVNKLH